MPETTPQTKSRTVRLDISPSIYNKLEWSATQQDIGVSDMIRHIIVGWIREHPIPEDADLS